MTLEAPDTSIVLAGLSSWHTHHEPALSVLAIGASEIAGGATYDAVVAETARLADAQLVTLDSRASRTYEVVGARYTLLGS